MHTISHIFVLIVAVSAVSAAAVAAREEPKDCPYDEDDIVITLRDENTRVKWTLELSLWGEGASSCVYDVTPVEGSAIWEGSRLAKTPKGDEDASFSPTEIEALRGIGELHTLGRDENNIEWMVIEKHDGKVITETAEWQEMFPEGCNMDYSQQAIEDCWDFMDGIYQLIANRAVAYVRQGGFDHGGKDFRKFLFNDRLTAVSFIDWRNAIPVDVTDDNIQWVRGRYTNLEATSNLPIDDVEEVQGVCDSALRREQGAEWQVPWDTADASDGSDSDDSDGWGSAGSN